MAEGKRRIRVTPVVEGLNKFLGDFGKMNAQYAKTRVNANLVNKAFERLGVRMLQFERRGKSQVAFLIKSQKGFASKADVAKKLGIRLQDLGEIIQTINGELAEQAEQTEKAAKEMIDFSDIGLATKNVLLAIGSALVKLGRAAIRISFNILRKAFELITAPIRKATEAIKRFTSRVLAIATGVLIRDMIFGLLRGFKELASGVLEVVFNLSLLDIQLETLIKREENLKKANDGVAISFGDITDKARALRDWIVRISLAIPFEFEAIARTTAFGMAMGFTSDQARQLTLSVSAFAAGMGITSDEMERIIFNFGQMKAAGKVTGTEMRDLARGAFFPLEKVLNEAAEIMGIAKDKLIEFRKAAAKGQIDINAFFQGFINFVEKDFPDALERLGRTLVGVRTRFANFLKAIVGIEILGPTIDRITEMAANALDKLLVPSIIGAAKAMGQVLLKAFSITSHFAKRELVPALKNLAAAFGFTGFSVEGFARGMGRITAGIGFAIRKISELINILANFLSKKFAEIGDRAEGWGANIILSLARGMAKVIGVIVKVLISIAKIFTGWLKGGSPPKLLPDLDKWGAAAMTEYLLGWLKGDFSIFNSIASLMEGFIRSLPSTIFDEVEVVPTILKIRKAIALAINRIREFGQITSQEINKILESARALPDSFRDYIRALFDVEVATLAVTRAQAVLKTATEAVTRAQNVLNNVNDRYSGILDDLNRQLRGVTVEFDEQARLAKINEALASGLLTTEEQARLNAEKRAIQLRQQIRATEDQRDAEIDAAQAKIDAADEVRSRAEAELETAEARQKLAEDQLEVSRSLIDIQIKQNDLIAEQIALLERLAAAAAAGGIEDIIPEPIELPDFGEIGLDLDELNLDSILSEFADAFLEFSVELEKIGKEIGEMFDPLLGEDGVLSELGDAIGELKDAFLKYIDAVKPDVKESSEAIGTAIVNMKDKYISAFDEINKKLEDYGMTTISAESITTRSAKLAEIAIRVWAGVTVWAFEHTSKPAILGVITVIGELKDKWIELKKWWEDTGKPHFRHIFIDKDGPIQGVIASIVTMFEHVGTDLVDAWSDFTTFTVPKIKTAMDKIGEYAKSVVDWVNAIGNALATLNFSKLFSLLGLGPATGGEGGKKGDKGGGGGEGPSEGQFGLDLIVPAGFPRDTFPFLATTGERVLIQTKRQQRLQEAMIRQFATNVTVAAPAANPSSVVNNTTSVEVNATYRNVQSEAAIRHDVQLALAATAR